MIGAGALGSFFAARFARAGAEVALIARGARLAHIRQHGISIEQDGRQERLMVDARSDCAGLACPDLVLLCTKAQDLPAALDLLAPFKAERFGVLTVQNGVEAPDQVARALPAASVLAARVHGFFEMHDGIVRHVGVEPSVAFGVLSGPPPEAASLLATCFEKAGIAYSQPADMQKVLWEKFLLASTIGGVGAALGITAGQIKDEPRHWAMLGEAMREVAAVAHAKGVQLDDDIVERTLAFVAGFPKDATSSLQRDLFERRPSEFDYLTGAAVRYADALGMDVPVLREIVGAIRAQGLVADKVLPA